MSIKSIGLFVFMALFWGGGLIAEEVLPEVELLKEKSLAQTKLLEKPDHLILAVNGMCCRNCAIGIGKKVSGVENVDTEALPKGIHIDRQNGLLTVAVKKGSKINYNQLYEAIRKAGYDPVRLYQLNSDLSLNVIQI